jgi:SAM-dependent methyltransferase
MHVPNQNLSPFGAVARKVKSLPTRVIREMYKEKCGVEVSEFLGGLTDIELYECSATGMRFWRPTEIAGPEKFYKLLSEGVSNYYRDERWEYSIARDAIGTGKRVLEVGCGRGFFLRSLEPQNNTGIGLELNDSAIKNKVTSFEVRKQFVEELLSSEGATFDVVCSFQVLEHVPDPATFLRSCLAMVKRKGLLIISVPNNAHEQHRLMLDAFDLPPHHINHFTEDVLRKVADYLGVRVLSIQANVVQEQRWRASNDFLNRVVRRLGGNVPGAGHTIVAILEAP